MADVTNWAGNVTFAAQRFHRPATIEQLQQLVAGSDRLRVLGTGHSFNRIADTTGDQVSVAGLPPVLEIGADGVTVSAGTRYGELMDPLHAAGRRCTTPARCPTSPSRERARPVPTARATGSAASPRPSARSSWWGRTGRCAAATPVSPGPCWPWVRWASSRP
jgi:hypothetical protein